MRRLFIFTLSVLFVLSCYAQDAVELDFSLGETMTVASVAKQERSAQPRYPIHATEDTKTVEMHRFSSLRFFPEFLGYFLIEQASSDWFTQMYDIYDVKGNKTGSIELDRMDSPHFINGILVASFHDKPVLVSPEGKVLKQIEGAERVSEFRDGIALCIKGFSLMEVAGSGGNEYFPHDVFYINERGERVFNNLEGHNIGLKARSLCFGRRAVGIGNKYGFVDEKGKTIIPAIFIQVGDFHEGLAAAQTEIEGQRLWGYIDTNGDYVINPKFTQQPGDFYDGLAVATKASGKKVYINNTGQVVSPEYDYAQPFTNGVAVVRNNHGPSIFVDTNFKPIWEHSGDCSWVTSFDSLARIDGALFDLKSGEYLYYGLLDPFIGGLSRYSPNGSEVDYVNKQGEIVVRFIESEF